MKIEDLPSQTASIASVENGDERSTRERLLFESLLEQGESRLAPGRLAAAMQQAGIKLDDPRLSGTIAALEKPAGDASLPHQGIAFKRFARSLKPSVLLIERVLTGNLVIPDFESFSTQVQTIFEQSRRNAAGEVATYIPQLGRVNPELFGLALCSVDGQRLSIGDTREPFCVQSVCKPINYCLALEESGEGVVHRHIGREPSGHSFNELALNTKGLPHNPMINAGGIMSSSLIRPDLSAGSRFEYVLERWGQLAGGTRPGFSNPTYLSERGTADRNFALGYSMREHNAFPPGTDLLDTLEFYFQCCSLEVTAELISIVAATLANGGVCPITDQVVLKPETVQKCLSLMYSCGMYDYSGEWAFRVGLPAKSGVSGLIMVVVPNVLGLCVWSPRLDEHGNSVRGIEFCQELVRTFNFHNYDSVVRGVHGKKDPRQPRDRVRRGSLVDLIWTASEGDLDGMRRLVVQGVDPSDADYDGRTPLHLAASEGRATIVEYLLSRGVSAAPVDRWGNTPLDDADRAGHSDVGKLLREAS